MRSLVRQSRRGPATDSSRNNAGRAGSTGRPGAAQPARIPWSQPAVSARGVAAKVPAGAAAWAATGRPGQHDLAVEAARPRSPKVSADLAGKVELRPVRPAMSIRVPHASESNPVERIAAGTGRSTWPFLGRRDRDHTVGQLAGPARPPGRAEARGVGHNRATRAHERTGEARKDGPGVWAACRADGDPKGLPKSASTRLTARRRDDSLSKN